MLSSRPGARGGAISCIELPMGRVSLKYLRLVGPLGGCALVLCGHAQGGPRCGWRHPQFGFDMLARRRVNQLSYEVG